MKIVLVGPAHPFKGGIMHYTTILFQKLKVAHDVRYYAFSRQYPRWLFPGKIDGRSDTLFSLNGEVHRVLDSFKPWTWIQTARAICSYSPQILILPWWVLFWAPLLHTLVRETKKNPRTRIVFICHNVMPHERSLFAKPLARSVLGLADELIVHCEQDKRLLASILPHVRVHKIMHPSYDVFRKNVNRDQARAKLGWASGQLQGDGVVPEQRLSRTSGYPSCDFGSWIRRYLWPRVQDPKSPKGCEVETGAVKELRHPL